MKVIFQYEFLSFYYPSQAEAAANLKVQKQLSKLIIVVQKQLSKLIIVVANLKTSAAINY